ncbi:uncharacterized protein [Littorina saxatilis]|uniref:Uncharacterized protein n=1 Tax=Littorina saxatilis TaxID=31220 RepID=A0AAN9AS02_9CAEN
MSAFKIETLVALCLLSSIFGIVFATQASEREDQSVELTIYKMSESEWSNKLATFKTLVAAEAATYCTNNAESCGLSTGFLFTSTQVGVYTGPEISSKSLKVSIYLDFPTVFSLSATPSTQFVVNSNTVETIITNIMASLEVALGYQITYIGEEFIGIDPDSEMNKILIPIAFIILFAVIGVAIGLHMWNQRKEKAAKQKLLKEKRSKKSGRVRPIHTLECDSKQSSNFWPRRSKKARGIRMETLDDHDGNSYSTKTPESRVEGNGVIPTVSLKTRSMMYDSNQAENGAVGKTTMPVPHMQYEDRVSVRTSALPPLPAPEEEKAVRIKSGDEKEQEKKERRRRKREKKRLEKEAAGEEYKEGMESESEKSKSESLGNTLIPVEDDAKA